MLGCVVVEKAAYQKERHPEIKPASSVWSWFVGPSAPKTSVNPKTFEASKNHNKRLRKLDGQRNLRVSNSGRKENIPRQGPKDEVNRCNPD